MSREEAQNFLLKNNPGSELRQEDGNGGYNGETTVTVLYLPKNGKGKMVIDTTLMECEQFDKETLAIRKHRNYGAQELICYVKRMK